MSTHRHHRRSGAAIDRGPSPYLIGAAIGLLNIGAFAAFRKGIGVSGAYETRRRWPRAGWPRMPRT